MVISVITQISTDCEKNRSLEKSKQIAQRRSSGQFLIDLSAERRQNLENASSDIFISFSDIQDGLSFHLFRQFTECLPLQCSKTQYDGKPGLNGETKFLKITFTAKTFEIVQKQVFRSNARNY